ncbi:hypothetical protein B0H16DRAFT_1468379 [Mycena metata]|uniref:Uncharacterized protein n=1 Tax=Mycena metata TaxID=1033252 RepID=A0AAD7MTX8_9AGAR|nr:hypothetical protein B0H16DRAFT_1468379 [Mycena metata]
MPLALEGPFVAPPSLPETREIGSNLRPSQHLPTSQPPVYTPSDSFLPPSTDITPAYTSFFEKLNPKPAGEPDPTDYTSFWIKKSAPKPIPKPSERTSFSQNSVPSSQRPTTTTSHPVSAANVARNDPRSFGSNSTNIDFSSFGKFTTSEDYVMGFHPPTPVSPPKPNKRKIISEPDSPSQKEHRRRTACYESLTVEEKLDKVFDVFADVGWVLGDFMHHTFTHRDVHRSKRHATIVQCYLSGRSPRTITGILDAWLTSPDDAGYDQDDLLYTTATPYTEIRHARAGLTSMNVPTDRKSSPTEDSGKVADLASALMDNMKETLTSTQPLLYDYVLALATPEPISRKGVVSERRHRPPHLTTISTIAMIDFCRNHNARLYPLARGILYLSSHVPVDIITLNSHLGTMPSLGTIKSCLRGFSNQKAIKVRAMGRDTAVVEVKGEKMVKANVLIFDNSQHYRRQRERRIGRENTMVIGISATFMQILVKSTALDPLDKQFRISLNLRLKLTVEDLLNMINLPHLRRIGVLQSSKILNLGFFFSRLMMRLIWTPETFTNTFESHLDPGTNCPLKIPAAGHNLKSWSGHSCFSESIDPVTLAEFNFIPSAS